MGTWGFTDQSPAQWRETLHNRQVEVDLVASPAVRQAVATYIDDGMPAAEEAITQVPPPGRDRPNEVVVWEVGAAFGNAVPPYREEVLRAMKAELGLD